MAGRPEEVLAWLSSREADMEALLERLVRTESPTVDPSAQRPALALLAAELEKAGCLTRSISGSGVNRHLYARPRRPARGAPRQLVIGHIDTVWPVGTIGEMVPRVDDGRFYGPGAYDMKGGLVQLAFALRALREVGATPSVTPVVLVNSDEETGSLGSSSIVRKLARRACRVFVLEPAAGPQGDLKTGRKGVGRFRLRVHGRSAHAGSSPEEGISAILELSQQVQRLFALNDRERGITVNVGLVDGGHLPNVIAAEASASIDVRAPTAEAAREVERAIRNLRPVNRFVVLTVDGGFGRPPMPATERNRNLYRRAEALGARLGLELGEATMVGGGSDANFTSASAATLDGLGSVGAGAHAVHEQVVVSSLPQRAALLALLLLEPE